MNLINKKILNFLLIFTSLFIGLTIVEIFLHFEDISKPVKRISIEIFGQKVAFIKSNTTVSPLKLKHDRRELLIIGDSFVEGAFCVNDNTDFPSSLYYKLNKKANIVNLGVGGKNTADYIDFLDSLSISKDDIAIVVLYDNDTHISQRNCEQIVRQSKK